MNRLLKGNEDIADVLLGVLIGVTAFSADFIVFGTPYVDSRITMDLIHRYDVWGILLNLPIRQPHYPTWYFLPELLGFDVTLLLNSAFFTVSSLLVVLTARRLYGSYFSQYFAAALITFSPFMATQAGWLRMYAPLSALVAAAIYLKTTDRRIPALVFSLLAAVVHPFGIFIAMWTALWLWGRSERRLAGVLATLPVLWGAAFIALNYLSIYRVDGEASLSNGLSYTGGNAPGLLEIVVAPVSSLTGSPVVASHVALALIITVIVLASGPRRDLLLLISGSVLSITVASYLLVPVFKLKYMAVISPAVALVLVDDKRPVRWQVVIVAGLAALYLIGWVYRHERALNIRSFVFDLPL